MANQKDSQILKIRRGLVPGSGSPGQYGSRLLKTGQTVPYNSKWDDGYYQKGSAKIYTVLTAAPFNSTFLINLPHYASAGATVTVSNVAHTIVDSANGLAIFLTNDIITTNDANNPGPFTITTGGVAGTITCTGATFTPEVNEQMTISKQEAHSQNCALDLRTGLMWSNHISLLVGAASDGKMPFYDATPKIYDIFAYAAAANAGVGLAGYTDWRIPNIMELHSLIEFNTTGPVLDSTAFPSFPANSVWSSTTQFGTTTSGWYMDYNTGRDTSQAKTTALQTLLVRGGM